LNDEGHEACFVDVDVAVELNPFTLVMEPILPEHAVDEIVLDDFFDMVEFVRVDDHRLVHFSFL
jgi:hypothetical protein